MSQLSTNQKLLIRTDASLRTGTGHVMRCIALAQSYQEIIQSEIVFASAQITPALETRLLDEGMSVAYLSAEIGTPKDIQETVKLAQNYQASWLIIDGYQFGAEYQRTLKEAGFKLLCLDDCGYAEHYYADLVLNQNINANEKLYANREPYTQLLLGTSYVLLRKEFWLWRDWQRDIPAVARKILVTMGGSDPDNVTLKVIEALKLVGLQGLEIVVVIGGSNPHGEQLQKAVKEVSGIGLKRDVTNMPELMAWADAAISAGGTTCWELAFMGLPSLILVLAENQELITHKLDRLGVAICLGRPIDLEIEELSEKVKQFLLHKKLRQNLSNTSQRLVDGEGGNRVIMSIQKGD